MNEEKLKEVLIELQDQNMNLLKLFADLNDSFTMKAIDLNVDIYNLHSAIHRPRTPEDSAVYLDRLEKKALELTDIINLQRKEAKENLKEHEDFMLKNLEVIRQMF